MSFVIWLIVIIALIVVAGLVWRFVGGVLGLVLPLLVTVLLLVGVVWLFMDVNDLRQHFYQDEKLFLLDIDGELSGAFRMDDDGIPRPVMDLDQLRNDYPDLAAVRGDAYKVLVLTWPVVAKDIELANLKATKQEIKTALLSERPKQLVIDKAVKLFGEHALGQIKLQVDNEYPSHDAFRSQVFVLLASEPLMNPSIITRGMKQGTVIIYPETVTFKILKILPEGIGNWLLPTAE